MLVNNELLILKYNDNLPKPNIDFVINAALSIASVIKPGNLVIIESTCPVGTTEKVSKIICEASNLESSQINMAYWHLHINHQPFLILKILVVTLEY